MVVARSADIIRPILRKLDALARYNNDEYLDAKSRDDRPSADYYLAKKYGVEDAVRAIETYALNELNVRRSELL